MNINTQTSILRPLHIITLIICTSSCAPQTGTPPLEDSTHSQNQESDTTFPWILQNPESPMPSTNAPQRVTDGTQVNDDGENQTDSLCHNSFCDASETCDTCPADCGACPTACEPGFMLHNQACVPEGPVLFAERTSEDVCVKFQTERVSVSPEWEPTPEADDECDPGIVPDEAQANGVRRTNFYRWLAGLNPVTLDESRVGIQQACAVTEKSLGHLDHHPPNDAPCYSQEGYQGASSSNLSYGSGLAGSVDAYMYDSNTASLGHRRWILNPGMTKTAFGYKPSFSCMYAFSSGGGTDLDYVAHPPPGYFPMGAALGIFSFILHTGVTDSNFEPQFEMAVNDEPFSDAQHTELYYGYGAGRAFSFTPSFSQYWNEGNVVRVRATFGPDQVYTYSVVPTSCQ